MAKSMTSLLVIVLSGVVLATTASAHSQDYFPDPAWIDQSVEYYRSSDNANWTDHWTNNLNTADATWSSISSSDGFSFNQLSALRDTVSCVNLANEDSTVKRESIDGKHGDYALTATCWFGSDNERFRLRIDSDEDFCHSTGDDGQNGTISAIGVLTHEFGHAAGFVGHFASPCGSDDLPNHQTMCNSPGYDNVWRVYSLETHDIDEFTAEY